MTWGWHHFADQLVLSKPASFPPRAALLGAAATAPRVVLVGRYTGAGALWCGCVLATPSVASTRDHALVHCPLSPQNMVPPIANTPPGPWEKPQPGVAVVHLLCPGYG